MSILVNGLTNHQVPNYRDQASVVERLSPTVPDLDRVRDYWRSTNGIFKETSPVWTPVEDYTYFAYHGPGGFVVHFGAHVAVIVASCRYSAFVTMPALQATLLPAFRSVALALGGTRLIMMPDDDRPLGDAAMYNGASLDECVGLIRKTWGEPHSPTEVATEDFDAYNRRETPVWYVEALENAA